MHGLAFSSANASISRAVSDSVKMKQNHLGVKKIRAYMYAI